MHTSDEECTTQRGRLKHSAQHGHQGPWRGMRPTMVLRPVSRGEEEGPRRLSEGFLKAQGWCNPWSRPVVSARERQH